MQQNAYGRLNYIFLEASSDSATETEIIGRIEILGKRAWFLQNRRLSQQWDGNREIVVRHLGSWNVDRWQIDRVLFPFHWIHSLLGNGILFYSQTGNWNFVLEKAVVILSTMYRWEAAWWKGFFFVIQIIGLADLSACQTETLFGLEDDVLCCIVHSFLSLYPHPILDTQIR